MFIRSTVSQRRVTVCQESGRRISKIEGNQRRASTVSSKRKISDESHGSVVEQRKINRDGGRRKLGIACPLIQHLLIQKIHDDARLKFLRQNKITFKVRGITFQTFESTLNIYPETLLGNKKSRDKYFNAKTKEYVLDRCSYTFNAVLFYYQSKGILSKPSDIEREKFAEELNFFRIKDFFDARHRQEVVFMEDEKKKKELPKGKLQKVLWQALEFNNQGALTKCCLYFYLLTTLLALFIICGETVPSIKISKFWQPLETTVSVAFTFEYCVRVYSAPNAKNFVVSASGIIDFIAIIPYYTKLILRLFNVNSLLPISLLRVFRVFKLTRFHDGLRILLMTIYESLTHLISLLLSVTITSLLFAALMFNIEYNSKKENNLFVSIPDTFWYTLITATGVGYGDMYPETVGGKFVGAILTIIGVLLFCLPTPMLVHKFVECYYLRQSLINDTDVHSKNVITRMRKTFLDN